MLLSTLSASCATDRRDEIKKAVALQNLGNALVAEGKIRQGYTELLKAHQLDPKNPDLNQDLALVCRNLGHYDLALKYFNLAMKYKPDFPDARNNMGTVYLLMKEWDKAIFCFKEAANNMAYKTPQYAYNNMGTAYFNKGDYRKAIESYQLAVKTSSAYFTAHLNLARVYEVQEEWDKALAACREANLIYPRDAGAHLLMGRLLLKVNKKEEAIEELRLAVKYGGENKEAKEAQVMIVTLTQGIK